MTEITKRKLDRLIELCMKHGRNNLNPFQCEVCAKIVKLKEELLK